MACGLWRSYQQQRNLGCSHSLDPGSPSVNSLGRPGIRCRLGKEKVVRIPGQGHEVPASRGPCRAKTPRFGRRKITLPPLGEGRGGGCWRCQSQKASRRCMGALHPTSHSLHPRINNPPPTFGHLPRGGGLLLATRLRPLLVGGRCFFSLPLGRVGEGVLGDAIAKKPVADARSAHIPLPTSHILVKPPPAASQPPPRGEVLFKTPLYEDEAVTFRLWIPARAGLRPAWLE